jgi:hypothetical protein
MTKASRRRAPRERVEPTACSFVWLGVGFGESGVEPVGDGVVVFVEVDEEELVAEGSHPLFGFLESFPEGLAEGGGDGAVVLALDHEDGFVVERGGGVEGIEWGVGEVAIGELSFAVGGAFEVGPGKAEGADHGGVVALGVEEPEVAAGADEDGGGVSIGLTGDDSGEGHGAGAEADGDAGLGFEVWAGGLNMEASGVGGEGALGGAAGEDAGDVLGGGVEGGGDGGVVEGGRRRRWGRKHLPHCLFPLGEGDREVHTLGEARGLGEHSEDGPAGLAEGGGGGFGDGLGGAEEAGHEEAEAPRVGGFAVERVLDEERGALEEDGVAGAGRGLAGDEEEELAFARFVGVFGIAESWDEGVRAFEFEGREGGRGWPRLSRR